jgi:hypothetical protein
MGKLNKRRRIAKRNRASKGVQMERIERERAALAATGPLFEVTPTLPSAASEPVPKAAARSRMGRGRMALLSLTMAAVASVALVRACERRAEPSPDDAAALDSCAGDAAVCVALA